MRPNEAVAKLMQDKDISAMVDDITRYALLLGDGGRREADVRDTMIGLCRHFPIEKGGMSYSISTVDGSTGYKGSAVDWLEHNWK